MSNKKLTYTINLDANIGSIEGKLSSIKTLISKLTEGGAHPELNKLFSGIETSIDKIRTKAGQPIDFTGLNSIDKETGLIMAQFAKLSKALDTIRNSADGEILSLLSSKDLNNLNSAIAAMDSFAKAQQEATKETAELTKARADYAKVEKKLQEQQSSKNIAEAGVKTLQSKIAETKNLKEQSQQRIQTLEDEKKQAASRIEEINKIYENITKSGGKVDKRKKVTLSDGTETTLSREQKKIESADKGINDEKNVSNGLDEALNQQSATLKKFEKDVLSAEGKLSGLSEELARCKASVDELEGSFQKSQTENLKTAYSKLVQEAKKLGISLDDIPLEPTEQAISLLMSRLEALSQQSIAQATEAFDTLAGNSHEVVSDLHELSSATEGARQHLSLMDEQAKNEESFANRIKQFVGAAGAAKFFSDACRQAFATVKELDSVMTEMAMVTELDVGDYWDQMPEYTQRANELGVSIKGAYESATLFYQQGLKSNEVIALSNQTLKMAKIAGLDASEATDRMTAALRGFNMELNETSAQKVADVYSQLAAITASDVDEISTAMTKTASIASSAGMEFETTAAFLSQIIETTRESAETAGTAMKTVIARFQELKKDPAEIGEIDGETVDANKIETALRSVGVALRDSSGQFRALDEVFLELSSKWDGLSVNTQRYIATIAAGSRQQSRFIAMMSDYGRTQELVGEAQNSAGASQKQYEKNLDSLESKLTKLENAWNEFATGIMNSDLVKGAVDFLTGVLNTLNKVTSGFGKMTGMISKIGAGMAIFKIAQALITKFGKIITNALMSAGRSLGLGMKESLGISTEVINTVKEEASQAQTESQSKPKNTTTNEKESSVDSDDNQKKKPGYGEVHTKGSLTKRGQRKKLAKSKEQIEQSQQNISNDVKAGKISKEEGMQRMVAAEQEKTSIDAQIEELKPQGAEKIVGPIGVALGKAVKEHFIDPFVEGAKLQKETVDLQRQSRALTAAEEFGDGTGTGADKQYDIVESKIAGAETGADLRSSMGGAGFDVSAQAMGFDVAGNDFFQQFMQAGGVESDFEVEADENGMVSGTLAEGASPEETAKFNELVKQWNEIIAQSVTEFQSANQTIDAINDAMTDNAQKAAEQKAGEGTPEGKKAGEQARKNAPKLKVTEQAKTEAKEKDKKKKDKKDKQKDKAKKNKKSPEQQAIEDQQKAEEDLAKKRQDLNAQLDAQTKKQVESYENVTKTIGNVGTAISGLGMGLGALGGIFESLGLDGAAESFATLGNVMTMVGGAISMVSMVLGVLNPLIAFSTMVSKANTAEGKKEIATKYGKVAATIAETLANWGLTASMGVVAVIILVVVAAILILIAVVLLLIKLFEALAASTPEGKLKAAEEAAEEAGKAADEAAEAYKNLKNALDDLDDKYKNLENLTEGTKEWNEAVQEINDSVLDLISEYPELAQFMTNEGGVLTLDVDSEEVQGVLQQYQNTAAFTRSAEIAATQAVKNAEVAVDFSNLSGEADFGSENDVKAIAGALADGMLAYNDDGSIAYADYEALKEQYGYTEEDLKDFGEDLEGADEELKAYGESVKAASAANEAMYGAMAANAQSLVDTSKFSKSQVEATGNLLDSSNMRARTDVATQSIEGMSDKAYLEQAKKIWGDDVEVDKDGNITYKDAEGEEKTVTRDAAVAQMAAAKATEDAAKAMEDIPKLFKTLSNSEGFGGLGKEIKTLLATGGEGLTKENKNALKDSMNPSSLQKMWDELGAEGQNVFGSFEEFSRQMNEGFLDAEKSFAKAEAMAQDGGFNISSKMTAGVAEGYAKNMSFIEAALGEGKAADDAIKALSNSFGDLSKSLSDSEYNEAMSIINSIDWSDASAWEGLPETLRAAGINIPNGQLNDFIELAKDTAGAVEKIDLEALNKQLLSTQATIKSILEGSQGMQGFSEEFVKGLKTLDKDFGSKFIQELDGSYTYIGGTMEDLIEAINENTYSQLNEKVKELDAKQDVSDLIVEKQDMNFTDSNDSMDITNYTEWTEDQQRGYLESVQKDAKEKGIDLKDLKIPGLTNNATLKDLGAEDIEKMMSEMYKVYTEGQGDIQQQKKNLYKDNYSKMYLNDSLSQNLAQASYLGSAAQGGGNLSKEAREDQQVQWEARAAVISAQSQSAGVDAGLIGEYNQIMTRLGEIDWYDENGKLTDEADQLLKQAAIKEDLIAQDYEAIEARNKILEAWRTEIDLVENLNSKIEASQQKQLQAEKQFNKALEEGTLTTQDAVKYTAQQVVSLKEQANAQMQIAAAARAEFEAKINAPELKQFNDLITVGEDGSITVDYEKANAQFAGNEELGTKFEEYVEGLKELQSTERDAAEELEDIEDSVKEIEEQGKEGYNSLLSEIQQALVDQKQKEVDSLSLINDSLNNASSELNDKLQTQIDEERQARANEEAEKNLANSMTQLAYMQQDTSGANALQLQELEQKIEKDEQAYQDSLIDQSLQNLQASNKQASLQRERQITLLQAQVDQYATSQESWNQARSLLEQGLTADGALSDNMTAIFEKLSWFDGKSPLEAEEFKQTISSWGASALQWAVVSDSGKDTAESINETSKANATSLKNALLKDGDPTITESLNKGKEATDTVYKALHDPATGIDAILEGNQTAIDTALGTTEGGARYQIQEEIDILGAMKDQAVQDAENEEENKKLAEKAQNKQSLLNAASRISEDEFNKHYADGSSGFENYAEYKSAYNARHREKLTRQSLESSKKLEQDYWNNYYGDGRTDYETYEQYSAAWDNAHGVKASAASKSTGNTKTEAKSEVKTVKWTDLGGSVDWSTLNKHDITKDNEEEDGYVTIANAQRKIRVKGDSTLDNQTIKDNTTNESVIIYDGIPYIKISGKLYEIATDYGDGGTLKTIAGTAKEVVAYKEGGLADFTGPAWLDGTPSKPEYVLNAAQTEGFFQLIDVIGNLDLTNGFNQLGANGDNYFDININVDSVSNDYDVDQMANRIREIIYEDSMYRNVNTINNIR